MSDLGWSDARVDLLRKLWQDGMSASQIAKQLGGVTRNAVIGKVHRIGLSGRAAPSPPARTILRAPRPPRARPAPPSRPRGVACPPTVAKVQPARIVDEGPGCATLLTLSAHMCKWPIGDPLLDGFTYCGRPAEGPYCQGHSEVAYRPGKPKPLDRDPEIRRALARYSS
ncbi:GcrA cell cycle regulator [Phenylobacterium sp. LjRoot225]|uniref:GcrA family cell cycle regulator n=1 Tax=Phenylobacterium sp. LjRoot225 TaxID=3342285 RepID=UPI003ED17235